MHFILYLDRGQDFFHNLYFLATVPSIMVVVGAGYGCLRLIADLVTVLKRHGGGPGGDVWRPIVPPKPKQPSPE